MPSDQTAVHEILDRTTMHPRWPEIGQHSSRESGIHFASVDEAPLGQRPFSCSLDVVGRRKDTPTIARILETIPSASAQVDLQVCPFVGFPASKVQWRLALCTTELIVGISTENAGEGLPTTVIDTLLRRLLFVTLLASRFDDFFLLQRLPGELHDMLALPIVPQVAPADIA